MSYGCWSRWWTPAVVTSAIVEPGERLAHRAHGTPSSWRSARYPAAKRSPSDGNAVASAASPRFFILESSDMPGPS